MAEIVPVRSWRDLRDFLVLPGRVRRALGQPNHALHPVVERYLMGSLRHPDKQFWLARQNGQSVARIAARRHHGRLHFGFFDCLPGSEETVPPLLDALQAAAPGLALRGPYHFRQEDPAPGLLIRGSDRPPTILMGHHPEHYQAALEGAGLQKCMDLLSYRAEDASRLDPFARAIEQANQRGFSIRRLDRRQRRKDVNRIVDLFNVALRDNWGFERFEEADRQEFYWFSYFFMDPDWVFLAELEGELVGVLVILPNLNELASGRGAWGALRLAWRFCFGPGPRSGRAMAAAVLPGARYSGLLMALMEEVKAQCLRRGWTSLEFCWILENNPLMNRMCARLCGPPSRVYRLYERPASCP